MNLTDEQLIKLAEALLHTGNNVYRIAERMFGVTVESSIFDSLSEVADIFQCDECGIWMSIDDKSDGRVECCNDCVE